MTNSSLNLKSVFNISHSNELSSTFCLQATESFIVLKTKCNMGIVRMESKPGFHQSKMQISSKMFDSPSYNVVETLKLNEKQIYRSMDHFEKNDAMLSNVLFPSCTVNTPTLIKCQISPHSKLLPITASLSSTGSLHISEYQYDNETNESNLQSIVELCDYRQTSLSLSTFTKVNKLQEIVADLTFYTFDWCPQTVDSKRFLAALTKSRELIFYSISSDNLVTATLSEKLENSVSLVKWITHDKEHFLFVAGAKGRLTQYLINIVDGRVKGMKKVTETEGKLKIPISSIESKSTGDFLVLVVSKSHSVEIFCESTSLTTHVGLNVTGVTSISCEYPAFLITTLDNKIFFLEVTKTKHDFKIKKFERVHISENSTIQTKTFGAYGLAASKNKVLVYVALYPQTATDHLTLKQPLQVTVNLFSLNDPQKILIENESLRLTDFQDCVEAVRFVGTGKLETMTRLSSMKYNIGLTDDFVYYLKIQLLVTNAKLVFYRTRSETIYNVTYETKKSIKKIIEVIHAHKVLKSFLKKIKSNISMLSIRCLSNFITDYINDEVTMQPFHMAQQTFKDILIKVLKKFEPLGDFKPELCYYCEENIDIKKLSCPHNHNHVRCSITKLQLPVVGTSYCVRCNCNTMDFLTLKEVTGSDEQLCIYCDCHIMFT